MEGRPIEVGLKNFKEEVMEALVPVIVDFWAPWCGPCKIAAPVLEKIAKEYEERVKVCKINVDQEKAITAYNNIKNIPTLKIYNKKKEVGEIVGVYSDRYESDIKNKIKPYLKKKEV